MMAESVKTGQHSNTSILTSGCLINKEEIKTNLAPRIFKCNRLISGWFKFYSYPYSKNRDGINIHWRTATSPSLHISFGSLCSSPVSPLDLRLIIKNILTIYFNSSLLFPLPHTGHMDVFQDEELLQNFALRCNRMCIFALLLISLFFCGYKLLAGIWV